MDEATACLMGEESKLSDGGLGRFPFLATRFSLFQNASLERSGAASFGSEGLGSENGTDLQPLVPRIAAAIKPAAAPRIKRGRSDFRMRKLVDRFGV